MQLRVEIMQKKKRIFLKVVVPITSTLILFIVLLNIFFIHDYVRYINEGFRTYRSDFENIKVRILELSNEYNNQDIYLWVDYDLEMLYFDIDEVEVQLSEEERGWVRNIIEACEPEALSRIIYRDNRILFGMDGNRYAYVLSTNKTVPQYMSVPDEYWDSGRKKIEEDWYFFWSK